MTRPTVHNYNAETGETEIREMNDQEYQSFLDMKAELDAEREGN